MVEASDHLAAAIVYAAVIKANPDKFKADQVKWNLIAEDVHTLAVELESKRPARS